MCVRITISIFCCLDDILLNLDDCSRLFAAETDVLVIEKSEKPSREAIRSTPRSYIVRANVGVIPFLWVKEEMNGNIKDKIGGWRRIG